MTMSGEEETENSGQGSSSSEEAAEVLDRLIRHLYQHAAQEDEKEKNTAQEKFSGNDGRATTRADGGDDQKKKLQAEGSRPKTAEHYSMATPSERYSISTPEITAASPKSPAAEWDEEEPVRKLPREGETRNVEKPKLLTLEPSVSPPQAYGFGRLLREEIGEGLVVAMRPPSGSTLTLSTLGPNKKNNEDDPQEENNEDHSAENNDDDFREDKKNNDDASRQTEEAGQHFSSLLFSGDMATTVLEIGLRVGLLGLGWCNPGGHFSAAPGAMSLVEVAGWMMAMSLFLRTYNAFLEYIYFTKPEFRTQALREHRLGMKTDLVGRELKALATQTWHDRGTLVLDACWALVVFCLVPGFYPGRDNGARAHGWCERVVRLLLHQYVLSFMMYWAHRAGHVVPWLWEQVHGVHHQATHPLSRVTYQAHCFDNFMNGVYGHTFAQLLVPLDRTTFLVNRFLRIMESLEKHSGISCHWNLAHNLQRLVLPFAQMPHHHDMHHEGSKRCNFTFTAAGGLWDWLFGTRREAGDVEIVGAHATAAALDARMMTKSRAPQNKEEAPIWSVATTSDAGRTGEEKDDLSVSETLLPKKESDAQHTTHEDECCSSSMLPVVIKQAELARHADEKSLWVTIGGAVYDATRYAKRHPGGMEVLLRSAGRDMTQDFDAIGHSKKAKRILEALPIVGDLAGAEKRTGPAENEDSFWNGPVAVHAPLLCSVSLVAATSSVWGNGVRVISAGCFAVLLGEIWLGHRKTPDPERHSNQK